MELLCFILKVFINSIPFGKYYFLKNLSGSSKNAGLCVFVGLRSLLIFRFGQCR